MITVADVLELDVLANAARVVAGRAGLHRAVTWVHNAGVPDVAEWLNGGELLLATAINLPPDINEQRRYIQALANKGIAALLLAVGRYIQAMPEHLCEVAEAYQFPLIEIDYRVRFVDVAKAVNQRITQEDMALVTRAFTIHQTLTQLVLEGGGLPELAVRMAGLLGQSISIETERFDALASYNIADVDEARRFTQQYGHTDPRLVRALEDGGYLAQIRETLRPVVLPQLPEVGLEMERILAPIVVHGAIYGYMWIIADGSPLSDIDRLAIESGTTIAALMMLYREAVQSAEASLKGNLLTQLIEDTKGVRKSVLTDQALRYGVDLRVPYAVLVVDCADSSSSSQHIAQLYQRINRLSTVNNWSTVIGTFAGQVVLLVPAEQRQQIAEHITGVLESGDKQACIAMSAAQQGAVNVGRAHQQCRETLSIMTRLGTRKRIVSFDDLGYLHTLYRAGVSALPGNPHVPCLKKLKADAHAELFQTLEAYLDAGGNGVATAETLHIHRSTLNYRLDRIKEICGCDLGDPLTRTNLQVALKLLRLFEGELAEQGKTP